MPSMKTIGWGLVTAIVAIALVAYVAKNNKTAAKVFPKPAA